MRAGAEDIDSIIAVAEGLRAGNVHTDVISLDGITRNCAPNANPAVSIARDFLGDVACSTSASVNWIANPEMNDLR